MKFCERHWSKLQEAVKARGLWHLVAADRPEFLRRLREDAMSMDPLMYVHNAVVNNATLVAGVALMNSNNDGTDRCPLCYLPEVCQCGKDDCITRWEAWIDSAADDAVRFYVPVAKA